MRAGRPAGGANIADSLSLRDVIADGHGAGRLVGIEAGIAVAVVNHDIVAPRGGVGCGRDRAGLGCKNCRAGCRAEVYAVVPAVLSGQRMRAVAVGVCDLALIWQRIQPAAGVGCAAGIAVRAFIVVLPVQRSDALCLFLG